MLGSVSEAEDAVQETWIRLRRSRQDSVRDQRAWLTTIVSRVCIDMLRSRHARREDHFGTRVPEPIIDAAVDDDPAERALLPDSVGLALLVVLETLTPNERLAYVMHDMFGLPFDEIGSMIDRSADTARQLASRARRRVRAQTPPADSDVSKQREIIDAFLTASRAGDFDRLVALLHPQAVLRVGGAHGHRPEQTGAIAVAEAAAFNGPRFATLCQPGTVNGQPGLLLNLQDRTIGAIAFTVTGGLISTIDAILDVERAHAAGGLDAIIAAIGDHGPDDDLLSHFMELMDLDR
jgi:RNA polymerase sigma-70 factor (ECF subfamily)